jgi:hypothetical protein
MPALASRHQPAKSLPVKSKASPKVSSMFSDIFSPNTLARPAEASPLLRAGPPARPATVLTALRFSRLADYDVEAEAAR